MSFPAADGRLSVGTVRRIAVAIKVIAVIGILWVIGVLVSLIPV